MDKNIPTLIINILSIEYFSARKKKYKQGFKKEIWQTNVTYNTIQYNTIPTINEERKRGSYSKPIG